MTLVITTLLDILEAALAKAWILPAVIVGLQAVVVLLSFVLIRRKRRYRSEPLSTRLPGPVVHRMFQAIRSWRAGPLSTGFPLEPRFNADGRFYSQFSLLSAILSPRMTYVLTGMAVASNVTLYFLDNVLSGLVLEVSYEHLFYLNVLAVFFAVFQTVAFWQLDSDLLWHYRKLDEKWQRPGLTHKIYLSEALSRVRQSAGIIAEKCEIDGEDRIHDIRGDAQSVEYKEKYTKGLLDVVHAYTDRFYQLDKDPECYELVIEDLYILIGERTIAPLARTLCDINKGDSGAEEWFPVDYAVLVWQSSLALAANLNTKPSATCIIDFKQFREHYERAVHQHPKTSARRIFIISPAHSWERELLKELNAISDRGVEAQSLPELLQRRVTHLHWILGIHKAMGWEVKFMSEEDAMGVRARYVSGDLPRKSAGFAIGGV